MKTKIDMADIKFWRSNDKNWGCAAYDHGPFCRLCQELDDMAVLMLANVRDGYMNVFSDENGAFFFSLTQAGEARADTLIQTDMEAADLVMRFDEAEKRRKDEQ